MSSSNGDAKVGTKVVGGRIGIVGTGHRARVSLTPLFLHHIYNVHERPLLLLSFTFFTFLHTWGSFSGSHQSAPLKGRVLADIQLYTQAIADRPSCTLVALCDLNSERMKHHQLLLSQAGQPKANEYHPVSFPIDVELTRRMTLKGC